MGKIRYLFYSLLVLAIFALYHVIFPRDTSILFPKENSYLIKVIDYIYSNPSDILGLFAYAGMIALFIIFPFFLGIYFFASFGGYKKYDKSFEPELSIIIPSKDESSNLKKTIESVMASNYPIEKIEILAVISGSKDDSEAICQRFIDDNKPVRILKQELEKKGKPAALNYGISESKHDILVFYDAGVTILPNTLHNLIAPLRDKQNSAVIGPNKVENWKKNALTKGIALEFTILSGAGLNHEVFYRLGRKIWLYGKNWAAHKSIIEEVGKFDENALTEDLQISTKLIINNKNIAFAPNATCYESHPDKWNTLKKQRLRWVYGYRNDSVDVMNYNKRALTTVIRRNFAMMHYGHFPFWVVGSIIFAIVFWLIGDFYLVLICLTCFVFSFGTILNGVRKYGDGHYSLLLYIPIFFAIAFQMFQSQFHLPKTLEWEKTD